MKILFTCLGGMTSSLLATKLKYLYEEEGHTVECQGILCENDVVKVINSDTDYTIAYMHIMGLTIENRKEIAFAFDRILIAPQAEYLLPKITEATELNKEKICLIPGKAYSNVEIEAIRQLI